MDVGCAIGLVYGIKHRRRAQQVLLQLAGAHKRVDRQVEHGGQRGSAAAAVTAALGVVLRM